MGLGSSSKSHLSNNLQNMSISSEHHHDTQHTPSVQHSPTGRYPPAPTGTPASISSEDENNLQQQQSLTRPRLTTIAGSSDAERPASEPSIPGSSQMPSTHEWPQVDTFTPAPSYHLPVGHIGSIVSPSMDLFQSSIMSHMPHPSLHHTVSSITTPPISLRDPFDDGVNSFAHDPFANDGGSDPDEEDVNNTNGLSHGPSDDSSANASMLGDDGEVADESSPDDQTGDERQRASTSAGIYSYDLHRPVFSSASTTIIPAHAPHSQLQCPYSSTEPSSQRLSSSDAEDDEIPSINSSGLLPPSPPPFLRAFSAPVQPNKLRNLAHPNRRTSGSGQAYLHINNPASPSLTRQTTQGSNISTSKSDSHIIMPRRLSVTAYSPADDHLLSRPASSTAGSVSSASIPGQFPFALPAEGQQTGLYTLSLELADSIQAAIQTLLQLTPIHLFDSAKEQFSACSVQIPATSLTSLLTAMKNLNYLSEHIAPLCTDETLTKSPGQKAFSMAEEDPLSERERSKSSQSSRTWLTNKGGESNSDVLSSSIPLLEALKLSPGSPAPHLPISGSARRSDSRNSSSVSVNSLSSEPVSMFQDFDVGEMVQSVGDLVGGLAAQAGIDLVLFHGDVGMKHFSVKGDEGGVCYVLSHVIRQIFLVCQPGDAIEIGLHVTPQKSSCRAIDFPLNQDFLSRRRRTDSAISETEVPVATLEHRLSTSSLYSNASNDLVSEDSPLLCTFEIIHNINRSPLKKEESPIRTPSTEKDVSTPLVSTDNSRKTYFPGLTPLDTDTTDKHPQQALPPLPVLDSSLTKKMLKHISATLQVETDPTSTRRTFELALLMDKGSPVGEPAMLSEQEEAIRQPFSTFKLAREPTLSELHVFAETLRGKKVSLHASETSVFAKHLTSYLTSWGMDMRHIASDEQMDEAECWKSRDTTFRGDSGYGGSNSSLGGYGAQQGIGSGQGDGSPSNPPFESMASPLSQSEGTSGLGLDVLADSMVSSTSSSDDSSPSFIMIDDDVSVLRRRLLQVRAQTQLNLPLRIRSNKRPTLAGSRAKSSPAVRQILGPSSNSPPSGKRGVIIIHFTSLSNYSQVRDAIQSLLSPGSTRSLPEVMVIPKPVGPRRFLTSLHTAVNRPIVDPFFTPIATSPLSPSGSFGTGYGYFPPPPPPPASTNVPPPVIKQHGLSFTSPPMGEIPEFTRPIHPRTVSTGTVLEGIPPSSAADHPQPLHLSIPVPNFTSPIDLMADAANRYGDSARSGMLIQSPDGFPMGMFFDPSPRVPSGGRSRSSTLRDKDSLERRRSGANRPAIATFSPSVSAESLAKYSPTSHRAYRASTIESGLPVSSSRRDSGSHHSRKSPGLESQTSPLDRVVSPGASVPPTHSRLVRPKTSQDGTTLPGVLSHRNSNASRPRTPATEEAPVLPSQQARKASADFTPPISLSVSPPLETGGVLSPSVPPIKKAVKEKGKKKAVKDDGMIVPPINVLIVEDNPINQTILMTFMKKKKIKFGVANNGREAVDKWSSGGFHLILMDIQLPVMDGIEATREIRRLEKLNNIGVFPSTPASEKARTFSPSKEKASAALFRSSVIIVALTASSLQSDRVSALAAGCNDFLTKPVSLKWLERKIVEWGCMQALIDFVGWKRWRGSDRAETNDVSREFGAGADAQAKVLRGRLKIERARGKTSANASPSSSVQEPATKTGASGPPINIQQPTPHEEGAVRPSGTSESVDSEASPSSGSSSSQTIPLTNVPTSGPDVLSQKLEVAREEKEEIERREQLHLPKVIGRSRSSSNSTSPSIASVLYSDVASEKPEFSSSAAAMETDDTPTPVAPPASSNPQ